MKANIIRENLESFDGGSKAPREAKQICKDISKVLAFNSDVPKWKNLLNEGNIQEYIKACQDKG
jgi:DNA-binding transcriptional regulator GbsR (MarR family)